MSAHTCSCAEVRTTLLAWPAPGDKAEMRRPGSSVHPWPDRPPVYQGGDGIAPRIRCFQHFVKLALQPLVVAVAIWAGVCRAAGHVGVVEWDPWCVVSFEPTLAARSIYSRQYKPGHRLHRFDIYLRLAGPAGIGLIHGALAGIMGGRCCDARTPLCSMGCSVDKG
jgi:hypothetical protein